ncbi:unnamed protein product [Adineta steineri]|uniref:RBR-type E3 ubiquitin transferase n=1 Tax=Adineta steineri TaxID=433720 RepID=A0A818UUQ0_9BILA|nr:unnamed protein product [Adineta steineri]
MPRQKISPTSITTNEQMVYFLLTPEEVLAEITKTTKEINEVLGLPSTTLVRLILNHFHWDKNTLTERFYDDPEEIFKILNVANPYLSPSLQWNPLSPAIGSQTDPMLFLSQQPTDNGNATCRTCLNECPLNEFYSLRCRHQHCLECWQNYLEQNIFQTGCGRAILCPSRCTQIIDDGKILELLSNKPNLREQYGKFLINAFVETNRLTHFCPGNGCTTIIKMKSYTPKCAQLIECDMCKTTFCFQCSKQWHEPVQCSLLQKWEQKNLDESMTGTWMLANTKECPKCHSSIEKNGGCNHMTCRKPGCVHEFCWLCFGDWKGHTQCNVYHQEASEKNQSEAREILARYMHYFTRYQTHNQSLEFEGKLLDQVEQRKKEMQNESMTYTEQQAVQKAFDVLQQCRRTLKYTYPFAYYLERSNLSEIFEQNQADLERATETLSGFLENEIGVTQNQIVQLMDNTSYCEQRRKILVDHCKDGYSKQYWMFNL